MGRIVTKQRPRESALARFGGYLCAMVCVVVAAMEICKIAVNRFGQTTSIVALTLVLVAVTVWRVKAFFIRRRESNLRAIQLKKVAVSHRREDYVISNEDYRRGNYKENRYRKVMMLKLLAAFGNACAKCGAQDNGLDLDHFFMSKNEGGSFAMHHQAGHLINNAIPLCQTCNRRKSDDSYLTFFTAQELAAILVINQRMTEQCQSLLQDATKPGLAKAS